MSLDAAEKRIRALQRLVHAQEKGLLASPVVVTYDPQGTTTEGAERALAREMNKIGLEKDDLTEAGLEVIHVNLPWASGRSVGQGKYKNMGASDIQYEGHCTNSAGQTSDSSDWSGFINTESPRLHPGV